VSWWRLVAGQGDYAGHMARDQDMESGGGGSGLGLFDGVLIVGGGLIVLFVLFKVLGIIAAIGWFVIKVVVAVALIAFVARLVFRKRS
jgi:hypothetical protein